MIIILDIVVSMHGMRHVSYATCWSTAVSSTCSNYRSCETTCWPSQLRSRTN